MIGIAVLAVALAYMLILGTFAVAVVTARRRPARISGRDARAIRQGIMIARRVHRDPTAARQLTHDPAMIRAFVRTSQAVSWA